MNQRFPVSEIPLALLPTDHSWQSSAIKMLQELPFESGRSYKILDLGCGTGDSEDYMAKVVPELDWFGIDLLSSPEVNTRTKYHERIYSFDGIHIPFEDATFDIVFSRQVLEHVDRPYELLVEVGRVLKANGYFVGSVSQMEPYHSFSIFNWTPFALFRVFEPAGLRLIRLRPGVDCITLLIRSLGLKSFFTRYFEKESPVNFILELTGRLFRKKTTSINAFKLKLCGHLCFLGQKTQ